MAPNINSFFTFTHPHLPRHQLHRVPRPFKVSSRIPLARVNPKLSTPGQSHLPGLGTERPLPSLGLKRLYGTSCDYAADRVSSLDRSLLPLPGLWWQQRPHSEQNTDGIDTLAEPWWLTPPGPDSASVRGHKCYKHMAENRRFFCLPWDTLYSGPVVVWCAILTTSPEPNYMSIKSIHGQSLGYNQHTTYIMLYYHRKEHA